MTVQNFISKWESATLKERSAAQEHFLDLCRLLDEPTPAEADPKGEFYTFERPVSKAAGGKGFADVWKRGFFAWEYKGKRANLQDAYVQLLLYRDDLENPPLLVVCDLQSFQIHTNFTGTPKKVYSFTLEDLKKPETLALLKKVFTDPEALNPKYHRERVTREASERVGSIALTLRDRGHDPQAVAHFLMQMVFAFFAEDTGLLPNKLLTRILERTKDDPDRAQRYLSELFKAMATGGDVMLEDVPHFNGGLFEGREALRLEHAELTTLLEAAKLDWVEVEPVIFGTLFERSLDPEKRSQLGAHYTSREDILKIVEPVILEPLRDEWRGIRSTVETYIAENPLPDERTTNRATFSRAQRRYQEGTLQPIVRFLEHLRTVRVLDPACGSGNFLYVAFQQLKELEKEVVAFSQSIDLPQTPFVSPRQFYGLEVNVFAHELASIVVWIGFLQWNHLNGLSNMKTPILEKLDNIRLQDALLDGDTEAEWPEAEYIIGNPPFLGDKKMRSELSDEYVERLRKVFKDRVPGGADFVCYWFEKARALIAKGITKRAGLISTNSIRGGANRKVLERIKDTGGIFMAWSDEPWILEGAAVRVSIVGFDDGSDATQTLDGRSVERINPNLTSTVDVTQAKRLLENSKVGFIGDSKKGAFDVGFATAQAMLTAPPNPNGRTNRDVVMPWANGLDITERPRNHWIIDFSVSLTEAEAKEYLIPYEHLVQHVKPVRAKVRNKRERELWWLHARPAPDMRAALKQLTRYLATSNVSKHRIFAWLPSSVLPSHSLTVIARDDDYTLGVLHSSAHEVWASRQGTSLEDRPRYTPSTCFETFPFPRPTDAQKAEVEKWAKYLHTVRSQLLEGDDKLTMTGLYNALTKLRESRDSTHPAYALLIAHEKLDAAVAAAYGWEWPLSDEEILERVLGLNLERAEEKDPGSS